MAKKYRKVDEDFKQGATQLALQTGKPIAQVARDLGINEGTLGKLVRQAAPCLLPPTPGRASRGGLSWSDSEGDRRAADEA